MMFSIKMEIGLNYTSSWSDTVIDYLDCNRTEFFRRKTF